MKRPDILNYKDYQRDNYFDDVEKYSMQLEMTLKEIMKWNPLRNDMDAYLFHLGEYALGESVIKPRIEDYWHSMLRGKKD